MNLYDKERDHIALGKFYTDHVSAMTREDLRSKSDIAAELAFRDQRIASLEAEKAERERQEPVAKVGAHLSSSNADLAPSVIWKQRPIPGQALYAHPLALREPTEDECQRIANEFLILGGPDELAGRVMFNAVREVMTK